MNGLLFPNDDEQLSLIEPNNGCKNNPNTGLIKKAKFATDGEQPKLNKYGNNNASEIHHPI